MAATMAGGSGPEFSVVTDSFVNVFISSNVNSFTSEKKFAKSTTVLSLKGKLELITGASSLTMQLAVFDKDGREVCRLDDDAAMLGSYPVDAGMRIHVTDAGKVVGEFENTAGVDKYEMSPSVYSKRGDTVQSYLKRNKMGKYNEAEMKLMEEEKEAEEKKEAEVAAKLTVGDRCEVSVPGSLSRRGSVRFVGEVDFKSGWWAGIEYDEPLGKNDGSVDGRRYFSCRDKYGGFVRVASVTVGDFPEEEILLTDEDDEM